MMKKPPHQVSLRVVIIVAAVVFAVVAIAAIFFATQFFAHNSNSQVANDEVSKRIISKVENIYMLPEGQPTVAEVQDKEKLDSQAFFDKVENGDYLVVYSDAKLALLYRESADKLVNVGPIALDDTMPEATSDPMSVDTQ